MDLTGLASSEANCESGCLGLEKLAEIDEYVVQMKSLFGVTIVVSLPGYIRRDIKEPVNCGQVHSNIAG